MKTTQANDSWFQGVATRDIHMEQLKKAERFNGRAAMLGIVIGIITEGLTGAGIIHQIGLGPLVDGYAACRTQFLRLNNITCYRSWVWHEILGVL